MDTAPNETAGVPSLGDAVVPNRWQGETGCLVGPFSSKTVAEYFATFVVNVGDYGASAGEVVVKQDSWYLSIERCDSASGRRTLTPPSA